MFTQEALKMAYDNGGYILKGYSVYQVCYSENAKYSTLKLLTLPRDRGVPLTNRGFWHYGDGAFVNKILGFDLVKEN